MAENIYFKPKTTPKEREECFQWFEQRMERLPKELSLKALDIQDLPRFVSRSITSLRGHLPNSAIFEGQFALLRLVQERLRQDPDFQE